jgi:hypothetical protein
MKMRLQAVLLMCVLVIGLAATDATASGRKGFMLGVGLGAGFTWHKTELDPMTSDFLDLEHGAWHEFGIADALRIGYAPTNQIQIYLGGTAMFMDVEGESSQMVSGLSGLGVTYFFDEEAPRECLATTSPHGRGGCSASATSWLRTLRSSPMFSGSRLMTRTSGGLTTKAPTLSAWGGTSRLRGSC